MKILFVDTTHPALPTKLSAAGFRVDYYPEKNVPELQNILPQYEGLIIRSRFKLDADRLKSAINLRFIGRVGAGLENIDLKQAKNQGITCYNVPEGNRDAVGEHAVGLLLNLFNNITKAHNEVRQGQWLREDNRGIEIKGKTIGIIGYGNMGSAFARCLSGFEAEVIAYDKYKSNYGSSFVNEVAESEIFEKTDILSLHVPLSDETTWLLDTNYINRFRKPIYIINTARGKVVKTSDLVTALKSGKILGAALDVLEYESLSFENLFQEQLPDDFNYLILSGKTVLSPHIAGWTHESNFKMADILADKIIRDFGSLQ